MATARKKLIKKTPSRRGMVRTEETKSDKRSWSDVPRSKWDPWFVKLYEYCAAKPGAWEDHPWGEIVLKFGKPGKVFAFLGLPDAASVVVKATEDDFDRLLSLRFVTLAKYIGRFGWVVIQVSSPKTLKVAFEGIDKSYEQVSPKPKPEKRKSGKK